MRLPWQKPTVQQQLVKDVKSALANQLTQNFTANFMGGFVASAAVAATQQITTILGWKKVPVVTADPEEDKKDQESIYNSFQAKVNGDRDTRYGTPDSIDIKAFANDDMDPKDRAAIYDVIDAINEVNYIDRTGQVRDEEAKQEENRQVEEETGNVSEPQKTSTPMFNLQNLLAPILNQFVSIAMTVVGMLFTVKLLGYLDKIKV